MPVPGTSGAQDTFYVGTLKGVGRIYQQTFVDTYAKVGFAKRETLARARRRRDPGAVTTAITAADLLNDRVLPFYEGHGIPLSRVLTDRGSEYCGNPERHEYELYLAIEDIDRAAGMVRVCGKRRREVRLPLPQEADRRGRASRSACHSSGRRHFGSLIDQNPREATGIRRRRARPTISARSGCSASWIEHDRNHCLNAPKGSGINTGCA